MRLGGGGVAGGVCVLNHSSFSPCRLGTVRWHYQTLMDGSTIKWRCISMYVPVPVVPVVDGWYENWMEVCLL
jgi:hypothetical protein